MKNINKKFLVLFFPFFILYSCTENFGSISTPGNKTIVDDTKTVRGPSGVGSGGGVIIVENNGRALPDTKYDLYLQENGSKEKLQNGTTDKDGKIQLSESKLNSERIRKLENGSLRIIIEVYDGKEKTAVNGKVIVQSEKGNETEIDLG